MKKRILISSIVLVGVLIIILGVLIISGTLKKNSKYKVINAQNSNENEIAVEHCNKIIKYLEDKYNEKFYVKFTWYSEEFSRLYYASAYSFENPDKEFDVQILYPEYNDGKSYSDDYIFQIAKENVTQYFYEIFKKYHIVDRQDFEITNQYELDTTNINKEAFNKNDSISMEIYLDKEKFTILEENMPNIVTELNDSIATDREGIYPNFYIKAYIKEKNNYDNTISNDSYLDIQIYKDNRYTARRVNSFPKGLFENTTN